MIFVYVLKSLDRKYLYVGMTNNLQKRLSEHNDGKERTTKPYAPFILLHVEQFPNRVEGRRREKMLKSGSGKEWIKQKYELE